MYALTPYPITPLGNFIGVVLALVPLLSSQLRNLSLAVWGYALWIASTNFIMFVNTIIWHDNTNIVASVWCDIVTKLMIGTGIGTRACAFIIIVHLYRMASLQRTGQERTPRALILEILLIVGLPIVVMALYIIVQPLRFEIFEELGCTFAEYSYIGYIIFYVPVLGINLVSAILAVMTWYAFRDLRRKPKQNSVLNGPTQDDEQTVSNNQPDFKRYLVIASLDTAFNLPMLIFITTVSVISGSNDYLNYPYVSWKNVHNGAGGNLPGMSLSTIVPVPASDWSTNGWNIFNVKWNEWLYVAHAIMFFGVFGTTRTMRTYYSTALWYIPKRLGYEREKKDSSTSDPQQATQPPMFDTNIGVERNPRHAHNNNHDPLSSIESGFGAINGLEAYAGMPVKEGDFTDNHSRHSCISGNPETEESVLTEKAML